MYEAFYGLRERPFNLTPDPKFLYLSEKHREAFAHLLFGIKNRSGFVMISGEIGTGKTTLCRNMLNQMDANTEVAFIFNPFLNPVELMKKINQEFGLDSRANNILALTEELNVHLLNAAAHGKNCVLVIDEAQNLPPQVLEQIRLLSNLETDSEKLLQIILIGQPELAEKLDLHELRQLNQRITARYHLKALNREETLQYIAYRIHVAGGRKRVNFTPGAIRSVYRVSSGVPRMINALCDRALLIGYTREQRVITAAIIRRAAREIRGEKIVSSRKRVFPWRRLLPSPATALLLVIALGLTHYLVDPLDRFARELGAFNRLLSGESAPLSGTDSDRVIPAATADIRGEEEEAPFQSAPPVAVSPALQQVMERLNAAASTRPSQSLEPLFAEVEGQDALFAGLDALVALWKRDVAREYPESSTPEALVAFFDEHALACEHLTPTLDQLLTVNLPTLAKFRSGARELWLGLVRADDDSVTLVAGANRRVTVSHDDFLVYYANEALTPWKDPAPGAPVLLQGHRGVQVLALKERLRALGHLDDANTTDIYDRETEAAVIAIQRDAGLTPDGKAGQQVRFAVTSWTGDTPALRRGGMNRAMRTNVTSSRQTAQLAVVPAKTALPAPSVPIASGGALPLSSAPDFTPPPVPEAIASVADDIPYLAAQEQEPAVAGPSSDGHDATEQARDQRFADMLRRRRFSEMPEQHANAPDDSDRALMTVRELEDVFVLTPVTDGAARHHDGVTPPVLGSAPLAPVGGTQP